MNFCRTRSLSSVCCLVNPFARTYDAAMQMRYALLAVLIGGTASSPAEVVQLRDKAAVTGKVLAEKKDQVVVDLGFTVLSIPKSQIIRISKENSTDSKPQASPAPSVAESTKTTKAPKSDTARST